jgi:hypothetical protein
VKKLALDKLKIYLGVEQELESSSDGKLSLIKKKSVKTKNTKKDNKQEMSVEFDKVLFNFLNPYYSGR